jgi:hypothetical protein
MTRSIEYFRPTEPCQTDAAGYPIPQLIGWACNGQGGYYWEIDFCGIGGGISGDSVAECLTNWLDEYKDEIGKAFQPAPPARKQLSLAF